MIREPDIKQRIPKKYFIIIFLVIGSIVGIVFYVFQKQASTGFNYLNEQLIPPQYMDNPSYCREDGDCMIFHEVCSSRVVNKYNFDHNANEENIKSRDLARCEAFSDLTSPRCDSNLCVADFVN